MTLDQLLVVRCIAEYSNTYKESEKTEQLERRMKYVTYGALIFDFCLLVFTIIADEFAIGQSVHYRVGCGNEDVNVPLLPLELIGSLTLLIMVGFLVLACISYCWRRKYSLPNKIIRTIFIFLAVFISQVIAVIVISVLLLINLINSKDKKKDELVIV